MHSKGMLHSNGTMEYWCTLRYLVPENDKGIRTSQRVDVQAETRSKARERAAFEAYRFVMNHGLWMNLKNAGIEPKPEDAINQLQELYQKKYVEQPVYTFEEIADGWRCDCLCGGVNGYGSAAGKTAAKKKAAFMVLRRLMMSAGPATEERRYARETQQEAVEPVRNPGSGKISVPDFPAARGMLGGVTF